MASYKVASSILIVAMIVMALSHVHVGHALGGAAPAEAYVQASLLAESKQAQLHGEAENDGSPRHCYGNCIGTCLNPFPSSDPDLCATTCKAKCQL